MKAAPLLSSLSAGSLRILLTDRMTALKILDMILRWSGISSAAILAALSSVTPGQLQLLRNLFHLLKSQVHRACTRDLYVKNKLKFLPARRKLAIYQSHSLACKDCIGLILCDMRTCNDSIQVVQIIQCTLN